MKIAKLFLASAMMIGSSSLSMTAEAQARYVDDAAFTSATSTQNFITQSFETAPIVGPSSLDFGDVKVTCAGTTYCAGFFGRSTLLQTDGGYSVVFASPDAITFSFENPITAFGVDVVDLGTIGATNFFVDIGKGPVALLQNYEAGGVAFAGITDVAGFTSVTFTSTRPDDGIYFDRVRFSAAVAPVPEPATWLMMILGFGGVGFMLRRARRSTSSIAVARLA